MSHNRPNWPTNALIHVFYFLFWQSEWDRPVSAWNPPMLEDVQGKFNVTGILEEEDNMDNMGAAMCESLKRSLNSFWL